jgi:hypothetical protein
MISVDAEACNERYEWVGENPGQPTRKTSDGLNPSPRSKMTITLRTRSIPPLLKVPKSRSRRRGRVRFSDDRDRRSSPCTHGNEPDVGGEPRTCPTPTSHDPSAWTGHESLEQSSSGLQDAVVTLHIEIWNSSSSIYYYSIVINYKSVLQMSTIIFNHHYLNYLQGPKLIIW